MLSYNAMFILVASLLVIIPHYYFYSHRFADISPRSILSLACSPLPRALDAELKVQVWLGLYFSIFSHDLLPTVLMDDFFES